MYIINIGHSSIEVVTPLVRILYICCISDSASPSVQNTCQAIIILLLPLMLFCVFSEAFLGNSHQIWHSYPWTYHCGSAPITSTVAGPDHLLPIVIKRAGLHEYHGNLTIEYGPIGSYLKLRDGYFRSSRICCKNNDYMTTRFNVLRWRRTN